jgi:hypothetical protein
MVSNGDHVVAQGDEFGRGNRGGREGTGFKHGCSDGKRRDDAVTVTASGVSSTVTLCGNVSVEDSEVCLSVRPIFAFTVFIPIPIPWTRNAIHPETLHVQSSAGNRNAMPR